MKMKVGTFPTWKAIWSTAEQDYYLHNSETVSLLHFTNIFFSKYFLQLVPGWTCVEIFLLKTYLWILFSFFIKDNCLDMTKKWINFHSQGSVLVHFHLCVTTSLRVFLPRSQNTHEHSWESWFSRCTGCFFLKGFHIISSNKFLVSSLAAPNSFELLFLGIKGPGATKALP